MFRQRIEAYRIMKWLLMDEVSEGRVRGRPKLGWKVSVTMALGSSGMTMEATRQCAADRKE